MAEPSVCVIMLTRDRPEMARRAIRAFQSQSYGNKGLYILDSGLPFASEADCEYNYTWAPLAGSVRSIGRLRNAVNAQASGEILIHWDDDDWSAPTRIAEQVDHLVSSGADAVGYNRMLFWREKEREAWLYKNARTDYALGTSLCYKRSFWEQHPFKDLPGGPGGTGEDTEFIKGANVSAVSSLIEGQEPSMVASIHGGNTMPFLGEEDGAETNWKRVPEFDAYCAETMKGNYIHDYLGQGEE